jgi:hypothetical protein
MFDTLSENCIFYISPMYEFSHRLGHKQTFGSRPPWSAYPHKQTSTDAIGMFEGTVAAAPDISAISVPIPCSLKNFP